MKKVLSLLLIVISALVLVACGKDNGKFPEVKESEEVELTAAEWKTIIEGLETPELKAKDVFSTVFEADINLTEATLNHDFFSSFGDVTGLEPVTETGIQSIKITAKVAAHVQLAEKAEDVEAHISGEASVDLKVDSAYESSRLTSLVASASFGLYVVDATAYINVAGNYAGVKTEIKNQLPTKLTQAEWDQAFNEIKEGVESSTSDTDFDALAAMVKEFDAFKVYKKGNKYTFTVNFNKENAYETITKLFFAVPVDGDEPIEGFPTKAQFDEMIGELLTDFEFKVALVIEKNQITGIHFEATTAFINTNEKVSLKWSAYLGGSVPKFPSFKDYVEGDLPNLNF